MKRISQFVTHKKELVIISLLFIFAFSVRFYVVFISGMPSISADTYSYFDMAEKIIDGLPYSYFPNGYPLLIAGAIAVFGEGGAQNALLVFNLFASFFVVVLVYLIGKKCFGNYAAIFAMMIISFWPNQLNYTRQLLTEAPTTFLLTLSIYLLVTKKPLSAGASLWAASMFRSTISPIIFFYSFFYLRQKQYSEFAKMLTGAVLIGGVEFLLIWNGFIARPTNAGPNFLISIASDSISGVNYSIDQFSAEQRASPVQTYLQFAINEPSSFVFQRVAAFWELWGPWPSAGSIDLPRSNLARSLIGLRFSLVVFAMLGTLWYGLGRKTLILWGPILVITLVHTMFFSTPRFTYPVEPCLALLASLFFQELSNRMRKKDLVL